MAPSIKDLFLPILSMNQEAKRLPTICIEEFREAKNKDKSGS
jgi:hypothetical protein